MYLKLEAKIKAANAEEAKILEVLKEEPLVIDDIIGRSGLSAPIVTATLMVMELDKKVRDLGNGKFVVYS